MPTLEGYEHADTPHEKTVAASGWRYGCHRSSAIAAPRGVGTSMLVQDGWTEDGRRLMVWHYHDPIPMSCGHSDRGEDAACVGCANRVA